MPKAPRALAGINRSTTAPWRPGTPSRGPASVLLAYAPFECARCDARRRTTICTWDTNSLAANRLIPAWAAPPCRRTFDPGERGVYGGDSKVDQRPRPARRAPIALEIAPASSSAACRPDRPGAAGISSLAEPGWMLSSRRPLGANYIAANVSQTSMLPPDRRRGQLFASSTAASMLSAFMML